MSDKIYFVRHGESMGNVDSICYGNDDCNFLTGFGVKQAELCGEYFRRRGINFDYVVSSGLTRARHTMSTILQEMHMPTQVWHVEKGLNEINHSSDRLRVKSAFHSVQQNIWRGKGTMLIVSHYHTMQEIWEHCLNLKAENVPGEGKIIRNAVPFVWDPEFPDKLTLIELNDIRYNIRNG